MVSNSPPHPDFDTSDTIVDRELISSQAQVSISPLRSSSGDMFAESNGTTTGIVLLDDVPSSQWTYGCTATSAGMLFGYYDRTGYPNMYTGPANGGVAPLTNLGQGDVPASPIAGACSIIATQAGFDGRAPGTPGHVDDYWTGYNDPGPDPWGATGVEHTWGDCTADYMGTNQWKWDLSPSPCEDGVDDANRDGSTHWFYKWNGDRYYDPLSPSDSGSPRTGCAHGMRTFAESRGYTVTTNYSQLSDNRDDDGFSFSDLKNEIDQGYPVIIHIVDHTMLALGYNDHDNTIYIHDTWDNELHYMEWGGSYSGLGHRGVTVLHLDPTERDPQFDYGDAPIDNTSYPVTFLQNGARHTVDSDVYLGHAVDRELDGQPNAEADGDDLHTVPDDEDGVTFVTHLIPGENATIEVTASTDGFLGCWIDFARDRDWNDTIDEVYKDLPISEGINTLTFPVPASAWPDELTYARFRFATHEGVTFTGEASDGEVEDYQVLIGLPQIRGEKWNDVNANGVWDAGEPAMGGWTVYCDMNDNGIHDPGEPFGVTDGLGEYVIRDLEPGNYVVREERQEEWLQTYPGRGTEELDLVTVPDFEEGAIAAALPFHIAEYEDVDQIRHQQIYAASEFRFQEAGSTEFWQGGIIDEIRFRQDEYGSAFATTDIDIQINVGYSRFAPADIAPEFAANISDGLVATEGYVTVYDGLLDLSSSDAGASPHVFDIVIDVDDLFYYDPSQGHLLVDIFIRNDASTVPFDAVSIVDTDTVARVWSNDLAAERGKIGGIDGRGDIEGLVTQFAFNPTSHTVPVVFGEISEGYDFGNTHAGRISGTKWYDRDRDGVQDAGEGGLRDWTIYIDVNNNGQRDADEPFAITDSSGDYQINGVPPGYHIVAEELPYGWEQTFPSNPSNALLGLGPVPAGAGAPGASAIHEVNTTTGTATIGPHVPLTADVGIARGSDGMLYTINGDVGVPVANSLYRINPVTGQTQFVGETGLDAIFGGDLDFDPTTGRLYGANQWESRDVPYTSYLFEVDTTYGRATIIGDAIECNFSGMAFDDAGTLWAADSWNNRLLTIDKHTGEILTEVAFSETIAHSIGMDFHPVTGELYLADAFDSPNYLYTVDTTSGALTMIGETLTGAGSGLWGLEFVGGALGTHTVSVGRGEAVPDIDFGNWTDPNLGDIQGRGWDDIDGDGSGLGQEPGLDNWRFYLDLDWDGEWDPGEPETRSNPMGDFDFSGLAEGEYVVAAAPPDGWRQTFPAPEFDGLLGVSPWGYPSGNTFLHSLDTATAAPTQIGETGVTGLIGLTASDDGTIYAVSAMDDVGDVRHLYSINPATGDATELFSLGTSDPLTEGAIEMMPGTDQIYVIARTQLTGSYAPQMFVIDVGDETFTSLGTLWHSGGSTADWIIDGLAFRGSTLYGLVDHRYIGQGPLNDHLVTISTTTREIVDVGALGAAIEGLAGLAYNSASDVFYACGGSATYPSGTDVLYTVSPSTGTATSIGDTGTGTFSGLVYLPGSESPTGTHLVYVDQFGEASSVAFGFTPELVDPLDFGDAPDPYPTLLADNGANHIIGGPYLGVPADAEPDGQPFPLALGDDLAATNDEARIVIPTFYIKEGAQQVTVDVHGDGFLYAWFDWNADGNWQPDELEIGELVTSGVQHFDVAPPDDAILGETFARFRISSARDLPPLGPAPDGEVEDHLVTVAGEPWDYGDAPEPYPTLEADNGAGHLLHLVDGTFVGPWIGDEPDAEPDGQPHAAALGDDQNPAFADDDEDGVVIPELMPGLDAVIRVDVSAIPVGSDCRLTGWIDFNGNGIWEHPDEQVVNEAVSVDGIQDYTIHVPESAVVGETFARFRVSTADGLEPTGFAPDGEVEDHLVAIVPTIVPEIDTFENVAAHFLLSLTDGRPLDVLLVGHATVEVLFEGPEEGDALDDDGNGLDEALMRLVDLQLSGMSPLGPIHVYLRDDVESLGIIEETVDMVPGRLDLPPFGGSGFADSFFDVFVEVDIPDGETRLHSDEPIRFEGLVSNKPAATGDRMTTPDGTSVGFLDNKDTPTNVSVEGASLLLDPVTEIDHYEHSVAEIILVLPNEETETIRVSGPTTVHVYFDGMAEGDAVDDDGDGYDDAIMQVVDIDLAGTSSIGPVRVRLRDGMAMTGLIEESVNLETAFLDIAPFAPDGSTADSFFDVFFQVDVGGMLLHTEMPSQLSSVITSKPFAPGDVFVDSAPVDLYDGNGETGFKIGDIWYMPSGSYDYGDAPDPTYPTLASSSGASHQIVAGVHLGASIDADLDGQPNATASGDDGDGNDDDDGVTFDTALAAGKAAQISVAASTKGFLDAWIDYNNDGDWNDAGEQIFASQAIAAGDSDLMWNVPAWAYGGDTFARFRFSTMGDLAPTGHGADGEVEDYAVTIDPNIEPSRDLGPVDYHSVAPRPVPHDGEPWYRFETTHAGTMTLVSTPESAVDQADLTVRDEAGTLLHATTVDDKYLRLDFAVAGAGEIYYFQLEGDGIASVEMLLVNLVQHDGTTVTVHGTAGADPYGFSATDPRVVTTYGVTYEFAVAEADTFVFHGDVGRDVLTVNDSVGDDTVNYATGELSMTGPGYSFTGDAFETVVAYARHDGNDTAILRDSPGKDKLKGYPDYSILRSSDYFARVKFFDQVLAYADAGGDDLALFYDSPGNDKVKAIPQSDIFKAYGAGFFNRAKYFDQVVAYSTGGSDRAVFEDTTGNDTFRGLAHKSQLYGTTPSGRDYDVTVRAFDDVLARASRGFDKVRLFGSSGDDHLFCTSSKTETDGAGFRITTRSFDRVNAFFAEGGNDTADLYDTPGDEYLEAVGDRVSIWTNPAAWELLYEVTAFEHIRAYQSDGDDTSDVDPAVTFLELMGDWEELP